MYCHLRRKLVSRYKRLGSSGDGRVVSTAAPLECIVDKTKFFMFRILVIVIESIYS